ncbi:MAG: DUF6230 family protein [Nocardioides sp.]|uniref:DUF6230 family protein n=1 Tax=Nocardioides sp. TaxID=35761 RepID=UPI0039E5CE9D
MSVLPNTNAIARLRSWVDAHRYHGPKVTGTRLKGAVPLTGLGLAGLGAMFSLVSSGAMAVNFTTSDTQFKLYSNYIQGVSAGGILSASRRYSTTGTTCPQGTSTQAAVNGQCGVAELGIKSAKLAGLCAIAQQDLPIIGTASLMIMAGVPVKGSFTNSANTTTDGAGTAISYDASGQLTGTSLDNAISATDLFLNSNVLSGYGNLISGLNLGRSADGVASDANLNNSTGTWPTGQTAPVAGQFGLTANYLNLGGLDGSSYGVNLAGQITLPKLKLAVYSGTKTQSSCPTEAPS